MELPVTARTPEQDAPPQEAWTRKLRVLMARIQTLQALVRGDEDGDRHVRKENVMPGELDREQLLQGLWELERISGELLYEMQEAEGGLWLEAVPGASLNEALTQLIETTAEQLTLSSRVTFSGNEHPLSDYLARLLYRIAREAVARVGMHEGARRLRLRLEYLRDEVVMTIEDDGLPGVAEQVFNGDEAALLPFLAESPRDESETRALNDQALPHLRAMVLNIGGSMTLNSGVEQGVQLHVHVPLDQRTASSLDRPGESISLPAREPSAKIKVLIVDGQTVSRAGLRRLLESYPDLEIVGEAGDSVQAVSETAEVLPQIVVLDAQLPENQSLETLRQLRQLSREIPVLLLANRVDEAQLYEALRAGAGGYLLKDVAPDELAQAVRSVARGDILLQPQLAARLLARAGEQSGTPQESLTAREHEVLQLLARGLRNKDIAARLFVSERTVNFHLANIYAKLQVSGRTEALSKALALGLLKA
jgi:DNA-binding NarL/FixJ family response regulator